MDLNSVANLIILISAVIIAGKNIYQFFKKPVDSIQETARKNEEQHIKEVLNQETPKILESNQKTILESLNEIKSMTLEQEHKLTQLQNSIDLITEAQLDVMRYNMNRIYYKYYQYKKILEADKKAFIKFYEDYHQMGGNTWIDSLYKEVVTWDTVQDTNDLKT